MVGFRVDQFADDPGPLPTDIVYVEHDPTGTPADRKVQLQHLTAAVGAQPIGTYVKVNPTFSNAVYDGSGNLTSWTESGVDFVATYDGSGNLQTLHDTGTGATRTYSYDGTGNLTGVA